MHFKYVIASCDKNKDRLDACLQTWLKDVDLTILGSDWHDHVEDDTHSNVWKKINKWVKSTDLNYDYVIWSCDDCYLLTQKLQEWLSKYGEVETAACFGHIIDCKPEGFRTGCMHVLNRLAVQKIKESCHKLSHPEDVSLYNICKSLKIHCIDTQHTINSRSGTIDDCLKRLQCGLHPVTPKRMFELHEVFTAYNEEQDYNQSSD